MTFKILWPYSRREIAELELLGCPRSVPWSLVASHEAVARYNHGGQTLKRLNERGGLSPCELCAVIEDRAWRKMSRDESVVRILLALTEEKPKFEL
jgi:hypothetical protein